MKLYYYVDRDGNFGDDLNPWLWGKLIPELINDNEDEIFIGIGTLLNDRVPEKPKKVVFGSGVGYGSSLPKIDNKWEFYCLRGPISADLLGLPKKYAVTDAAALVSTVYHPKKIEPKKISFIPHHVSARHLNWELICKEIGVHYIDPRQDVETVLTEISNSSAILTEAMHGAILADTFRVPWAPIVIYEHILHSKWVDWSQSLSLEYQPVQLAGVWNSDYNYSAFNRFKIQTKRTLSKIGINSTNWTQPPYRSTQKEIDDFINKFYHISKNLTLTLSDDLVFYEAQERLLECLRKLRFEKG